MAGQSDCNKKSLQSLGLSNKKNSSSTPNSTNKARPTQFEVKNLKNKPV